MDIAWEELKTWKKSSYLLVDTRGKTAYGHGHIPGAVCLEDVKIEELAASKILVFYCTYGEKSRETAQSFQKKGISCRNLTGGYRSWLWAENEELSREEVSRYDRQIILPQVGIEGQKKLKHASVLIIGAGGLGAPAALYLAGAGVGRIGIMDADAVSCSNLQRQIIHSMDREQQNKALSAKETMEKLNDMIQVTAYPEFLTPENAEEIISDYDFVLDAVDNFETKFLINDVCVLLEKPFCHGGILRFEGQVMTYVPGEGPCYRCVFEEIPSPGQVQNCSEAGVIGAIAGIIGSIQALEAIKYLLGIGELLTGKIYVMDGLKMKSRIISIGGKNPACKVCGKSPVIRSIKENEGEYQLPLRCVSYTR